jgi:TonB family protein
MAPKPSGLVGSIRENRIAIGAALAALALVALAARWVKRSREAPVPKRVLTITGVILKPEPPPRTPPPPPREQKLEEPKQRLVEVKGSDIPPPEAAPPPAAGPLALATEATGEGDAFNLVGNPGGRALVGPGSLGEGSGGIGAGDQEARIGWYLRRVASTIEDAFRKMPRARNAQARVEIRVSVDPEGRVTEVQLLKSTGSEELDEAIRSVAGLQLPERLPPDMPRRLIYRFVARRPG